MNSQSQRRRARMLSVVLALAVAAIAIDLARAGVADFLRLEPCAYLDRLQATAQRPDPALLGRARDRLELARRIDPGNPVVHEYLATTYVYRASLVIGDPSLHVGYLGRAEADYENALALRPNSPYLWAGLAAVRGALLAAQGSEGGRPGQRRAAFAQAMRRAMALAAYEPAVLASIARTGALHHHALAESDIAGVRDIERRLRALTASRS